MNGRERLRELLQRPEPLVMPAAWDCVSAKLLERAGFEAIGVSGAGVSVARLGLPDLGFLSMGDMADALRAITANVSVPVLADADTGFGNALGAVRTVREFTAAGAAGLHIEDQTFPKRCGHLSGKQVVSLDEYLSKLVAVIEQRPDPEFVIVARTDALAVEGVDAAIERANAAVEVGADVVMIEAAETLEQVRRIGLEVEGIKLHNLATGGRGPRLTVSELYQLGFQWIVMPGVAMGGVLDGVQRAAAAARRDGDDEYLAQLGFRPDRFFELGDLSGWRELDARYATTSGS